jgi:hypothetical protein
MSLAINRQLACALLLAAGQAEALAETSAGLCSWLGGKPLAAALGVENWGIKLGGWATVGYTYNAAHPKDRMNGPVSFNYRADEFHLHQLNLLIERPVDTQPGRFAWGGRFDFMFGTDSVYTQATGHWDDGLISQKNLRFYDIALAQAYLEIATPWQGLSAKLGHFYSIIGYESVASPANFFYSHSYSMKSSPFTHTGLLLAYPLAQGLVGYSGAVAGADNFDQDFGAWSYLGGFSWTAADGETGLQISVLNGDASERISDSRAYFSAVWRQRISPKLHYVLQHDQGWQDHAAGKGSRGARWHSIVHYLSYDWADALGVGLRAEWFRDQNGFRYAAGEAGYYAVTAGLNWKPLRGLMLRPELRYDWADSALPAYAQNTRNSQILIGIDAVIEF